MSATMLEIIQQATGEMGLVVPTAVASSNTDDSIQQLALLNAVGNELRRKYPWQALIKDYRFSTGYYSLAGTTTSGSAVVTGISSTANLSTNFHVLGSGIEQDTHIYSIDGPTQVTLTRAASASGTPTLSFCQTRYSMPADFDRSIPRTQWDKDKRWEMLGPLTPQQQEWLQSGYISTGPRIRWWMQGNKFNIWPAVTANEYLGFKYHSNYWVESSTGTAKGSFTADTDTCIYPDRLMVLGLKLKFRQLKGLETSFLEREFAVELDIAKSVDGGSRTLAMNPQPTNVLIGWGQIPDTGYGS